MHIVERGSGTPIVLIHGFGVDHRLLLPLDPVFETPGGVPEETRLVPRNPARLSAHERIRASEGFMARGGDTAREAGRRWHRLYVDLPGTDGTPAGEVASSEDVVARVARELRERLGAQSFALIGSSYGGMIARRLAHDFGGQVLGLATLAGVFEARHSRRTLPARTVLYEEPGLFDHVDPALAREYAQSAVVQSREGLEAFRSSVYPGLVSVDQTALNRIARRYDLDAKPEETAGRPFDRPTLLLTGRQDEVVGYVDAWRHLEHYPRATYIVLDSAGHNLLVDQPAQTQAAVAAWLARLL